MNGYELCRELRGNPETCDISTSSSVPQNQQRLIAIGA
jgi:CheY-like chemotaxis protein